MKRILFTLLLSCMPVGLAFAQQVEATPAPIETPTPTSDLGWKANAGASVLLNSGNSESQTFGGNGLVSHKWEKDKMEFKADGAYGRATVAGVESTNTKNWKLQGRYDRFLTDPVSLFILGHVGADEPAGFELRYGTALGLAHEIYKTDPHFFKYELGADYTREERVTPPDAGIYSARLFLQYKLKISTWATFGEDLETLFNVTEGDDIRINSLTALTMKLTGKVAFQAGYSIRFDNVPVPTFKKLDTSTQMGIVVSFL